jgi:cob(I)alamin adenosyltransferase
MLVVKDRVRMGLVVELVEDKLISRYSGSVKALHQYVHVIQSKKQSILHTSRSASRVRRAESVLESDQARRTRAKLGGLIYGPNGV